MNLGIYLQLSRAMQAPILVLILCLVSINTFAQTQSHNQAWFDVSALIKPAKNLSIVPEFGYRTEPEISLNQVYLRTFLSYKPNRIIKLSLGAAHFNSWKPDNHKAVEVRTSQFVSLFWPQIGGFKFEHRMGLDQRLFYFAHYDFNKYVHRSRMRIGLHSPAFALLGSSRNFYANASFELLRNVNQKEFVQWVDHDWITVILGYQVNDVIKLEGHVLLINGLDPITHDFEREISVLRIRFKYSFH